MVDVRKGKKKIQKEAGWKAEREKKGNEITCTNIINKISYLVYKMRKWDLNEVVKNAQTLEYRHQNTPKMLTRNTESGLFHRYTPLWQMRPLQEGLVIRQARVRQKELGVN